MKNLFHLFQSPEKKNILLNSSEITTDDERRKVFLQYVNRAWLTFGIVTLVTLPIFPDQSKVFIFLMVVIFPSYLITWLLNFNGRTLFAGAVFTLSVNFGFYGLFLEVAGEIGASKAFETEISIWMLMGLAVLFAGAFVHKRAAPILAAINSILLIGTRLTLAPEADPRPSALVFWWMMAVTIWLYEGTLHEALTLLQTELMERKLTEKKIQNSLKEKETLLKEVHHRVKNNLQVISSLLYLQSSKSTDEKAKAMILESQNRIISMSLIHEKLYKSTDMAHIYFADYARDLAQSLFNSYGMEQTRVVLFVEANGLELDINNAVPCGLIINEIVSNSLKYAFPNQRHGNLNIILELEPANRFKLTLNDDGVGLPADFETRSAGSLGIKLIERLTGQIQGSLNRSSSSQGVCYVISFPNKELEM